MRPSVETPATAYIAVGSNIDPETNILLAMDRLQDFVKVSATSRFYKTEPMERPGQPLFVNGVWKIRSPYEARDLKFRILRAIETDLGRLRTEDRHAPRTIDLDLVLFGDQVIDEPGLGIPDRDIYRRSFVAVPLMELDPNLVLPDTRQPLSSLPVVTQKPNMVPLPDFSDHLQQRLSK